MAAAIPFVVSAVVGTVVSKVGGALIGDITGNKELGNIVGMIGGAYAGGLAGGFMNPAEVGVNAATSGGGSGAFGAFDVADATSLAGNLGGGSSVSMNGAAAMGQIFGESTPVAGSAPAASYGSSAVPTTAAGGAATTGQGLLASAGNFLNTNAGMAMAGNAVLGVGQGLSAQAQYENGIDSRNQQWSRDDSKSRVVEIQPMRLSQRNDDGTLTNSKYV